VIVLSDVITTIYLKRRIVKARSMRRQCPYLAGQQLDDIVGDAALLKLMRYPGISGMARSLFTNWTP
jgi:hypothetical protein